MTWVDSNFTKLLRAIYGPIQELEDAFQQLLQERFINNATGHTLTLIGGIVGQERNGISDDEVFRRYVRARIATNKSSGIGPDMLNVARLILGSDPVTVVADPNGIATVTMTITGGEIDSDLALALFRFLYVAKGDAIRLILAWTESPLADTFTFDIGPGWDVGHLAGGRDGNDLRSP